MPGKGRNLAAPQLEMYNWLITIRLMKKCPGAFDQGLPVVKTMRWHPSKRVGSHTFSRWILLCLGAVLTASLFAQPEYQAVRDSLWHLIRSQEDSREKVSGLFDIARHHDYAPFTKEFLVSARDISIRNNWPKEQLDGYLQMGQYYIFNSRFDTAYQIYLEALDHPRLPDHIAHRCEILNSLAVILKRQDKVTDAMQYFIEAQKILENEDTYDLYIRERGEEDALDTKCILYNNVGNLYVDIKKYDKALDYYNKAIDVAHEIGVDFYLGTIIMNRGITLQELGNHEEALQAHQEAIEYKKKAGAPERTMALSDLNSAICLRHLGRYDDARNLLDQSIVIFERIQNNKGLTSSLCQRGLLFNTIGEPESALNDCERARKILEDESIIENLSSCYSCLYEANKKLNNYKSAIGYLEKSKSLNDSLLNATNFLQIGQAEAEFKSEKEMAIQQMEFEVKEQKNKQSRTILISLLLSFLLGSLLLYRNMRLKSRSEKVLSQKNKIISEALAEKDVLLKEIHHRVKNNLQVISALLTLQSKYNEDPLVTDALTRGQNRVQSIALIHKNLYQHDNLKGVDTKEYFERLIDHLIETYNVNDQKIEVEKDIVDLSLDVDTMIPLGLIVNELISNSLKHAFPEGATGHIKISLREENEVLHLMVADNGSGIKSSTEAAKTFGQSLVRSLGDRLDATTHIESEDGYVVRMKIKDYKKSG